MHQPRKVTIGSPRRIGIVGVARALGVGYPHLYKCLQWLNAGRPTDSRGNALVGRIPGRDLEHALRQRHPELIQEDPRP